MNFFYLLIAGLGLVVIGILPFIWMKHPLIAVVLAASLIPWAIWLIVAYLKWARALRKR